MFSINNLTSQFWGVFLLHFYNVIYAKVDDHTFIHLYLAKYTEIKFILSIKKIY